MTALKYCTDHQQLWRKRFSELPTSPNRDGRLCLASEKTSPGQGWRGPSLGCVRRIPAGEVGSGSGPSYLWGSQGLHVCVCVCGGGGGHGNGLDKIQGRWSGLTLGVLKQEQLACAVGPLT